MNIDWAYVAAYVLIAAIVVASLWVINDLSRQYWETINAFIAYKNDGDIPRKLSDHVIRVFVAYWLTLLYIIGGLYNTDELRIIILMIAVCGLLSGALTWITLLLIRNYVIPDQSEGIFSLDLLLATITDFNFNARNVNDRIKVIEYCIGKHKLTMQEAVEYVPMTRSILLAQMPFLGRLETEFNHSIKRDEILKNPMKWIYKKAKTYDLYHEVDAVDPDEIPKNL